MSNGQTLVIGSTMKSQEDAYTCRAVNAAGVNEDYIDLIVYGKRSRRIIAKYYYHFQFLLVSLLLSRPVLVQRVKCMLWNVLWKGIQPLTCSGHREASYFLAEVASHSRLCLVKMQEHTLALLSI